jgi:hypothetical protein
VFLFYLLYNFVSTSTVATMPLFGERAAKIGGYHQLTKILEKEIFSR